MEMWNRVLLFCILLLLFSCNDNSNDRDLSFKVEVMNKITPVKDQGNSSLCWAYAMLATIESECLQRGDSVNLSVDFVARHELARQAEHAYFSARRADSVSLRGVAPHLLTLLNTCGTVGYDNYHASCNYRALDRKVNHTVSDAARRRQGINTLRKRLDALLDEAIRPLPQYMWLYGMQYTPQQFARSVCREGEYTTLVSYAHYPYFTEVPLDVPDNRWQYTAYNLPIDSLMRRMELTLRSGHSICWEGDITEPLFSFPDGLALLDGQHPDLSPNARQRDIENFRTTDDHCMALVGIARDDRGRRYFICKNSWGTDNLYGGLMYMSFDYARMKTLAVVLPNL